MREIRTSGLMSGEGKRTAHAAPRLFSTLLLIKGRKLRCSFACFARHLRVAGHDRQGIPRSGDNPELRWVYDTEIVRDLVTIGAPVLRHAVAQEFSSAMLNSLKLA